MLAILALAACTVHAGIVGTPGDAGGPQVHQLADGLNHLFPIFIGTDFFRAASHLADMTGHTTRKRGIRLQPVTDNRLTFAVKSGVDFVIELQILRLVHCIQDGHIQAPVLEVISQIPQVTQLVMHHVVSKSTPELV